MNRRIDFYLILIFAILTLNFQCGKDLSLLPAPIVYKYWFKESLSVTPYQLTYKTGDTVWLNLDLPNNNLLDTISNATIQYDSAYFAVQAQLYNAYSYPYDFNGPFASYIFPDHSHDSTNSYLGYTIGSFNFGCNFSSDYSFRLGIVLLKKGVFELTFVNNSIGNCCNCISDYARINFVFDVDDTHLAFYQQLPFGNLGRTADTYVMQKLQNKSGIVFQVE